MSILKKNTKAKVAAGAVVVALSGFVPQPFVQQAKAASAQISITGTFVSGITMSNGANVIFDSMIASAATGFVDVDPTAAKSASKAVFLGTPVKGSFKFNAKAGGLNVDLSAKGFGKAALTGAGAAGSVTFQRLYLKGPFTGGTVTLAGGAGTTNDTGSVLLNKATGSAVPTDISAGARVIWSGTKPIGNFSFPATLTVTY